MGRNVCKYISGEGLRMFREHLQLTNKETNNSIKKWMKDLHRHFPKEEVQIANKHMKIYST